MSKTIVPDGYTSKLNLYETQTAIGKLKRLFEDNLSENLNLKRVSAPLFVDPNTGLNDDLNGFERPVSFDVLETSNHVQVVHSLAKWKRIALHNYGFQSGEGLYTDMNAIRRDEEMDNTHSIYVDQWDWEKVITLKDRNEDYLKLTVKKITDSIFKTLGSLQKDFSQINPQILQEPFFITTQELENIYPNETPKERENLITKSHKLVFLMKVGDILDSGERHDGRAPDYDDWNLNGDILYWNEVLQSAIEISSMGIRVDSDALEKQLEKSKLQNKKTLPYHKALLNNELPLTIGGGIGQSRLCMLLLQKAHVGEVQVSVWDKDTIKNCEQSGIMLL